MKKSRYYSRYKNMYFKPEFGDCVACGHRLKRDHVAWRKHIQTMKGKIFAFSYAYICSSAACGRTYRSAEADLLSLPFRTYSLDVLAEIGFLRHEEKRSIPEIDESLSRKRIDISERECYDLVHLFEELIATKPIELDQDFLEKAGENGGIVLAIDGVQPGDIIEFRRGRYSVVGMHCYGKQAVIRNGEKKMDVSVKKVRLVRYGKGLRFQSRFLLTGGVSSGGIR